jgi:hypothetical protein
MHMGFCQRTVESALLRLHREEPGLELEPLLRGALKLLTPPPSSLRSPGPPGCRLHPQRVRRT